MNGMIATTLGAINFLVAACIKGLPHRKDQRGILAPIGEVLYTDLNEWHGRGIVSDDQVSIFLYFFKKIVYYCFLKNHLFSSADSNIFF